MQKPESSNYSRFLKSDRAVLVICIGIALIFWTLTRLSQSFKTIQECNLQYNLPEGYILASDAPEKLVVSMEGVGWDLMSNYFRKEEGRLSLHLNTNYRQVYNSAQIISKLTRTQSSIDIKGLNIDMLELLVEKEVSKKVPIILAAEISFNPQYQLKGTPLLQPDSVLLSGPETSIQGVSEWSSSPIQLDNIDKTTNLQLSLLKPSQKNISISPAEVQFSLEVEQLTGKDFFVPIQVKNGPDSIKIFPNNIKISCVIGLSHYEQIGADDFTLEVDMTGIALKDENNTLPVILSRQPEQVKGVHLSHQSVEFFFVEEIKEEGKEVQDIKQ